MNLTAKLIKNSLNNLSGYLIPIAIYLFTIPFFISKLGQELYGSWIIISSLAGITSMLNLGLPDATVKFVSEYYLNKDNESLYRIIRSTFFLSIILGLIILFFGLFLLPICLKFYDIPEQFRIPAHNALRIAIIATSLNVISSNMISLFKGMQEFRFSSFLIILREVIKAVTTVALLTFGFGIFAMALGVLGGALISLIMATISIAKYFPLHVIRPKFDKISFRYIFDFSLLSFMTTVSALVKVNIGNLLIGRFLGVANVPYFSVPFSIYNQLIMFSGNIMHILFPAFSSFNSRGEKITSKKVYISANKIAILLSSIIAAVAFLLSERILIIWLGSDFAEKSSNVLKILMIISSIVCLNTVSYNLLMGFGRIKTICLISIINTIMIVVSSLLMIQKYGIIGGALVYIIDILTLIMIPLAYRQIGEKMNLNNFYALLGPGLATVSLTTLVMLSVTKYYDYSVKSLIILNLLFIALFVIIYGALDYRFLKTLLEKIRSD